MTKKQIKLLFIYFLKRNKVLIPFLLELYLYKTIGYKNLNSLIKKWFNPPRLLIVMAFNWNRSYEKYEFWSKLNKKWEDELNEFDTLVKEQQKLIPSKSIKEICDDLLNSSLYKID